MTHEKPDGPPDEPASHQGTPSLEGESLVVMHPRLRDAVFQRAQEKFNEEAFFEAHEDFETLWRQERGPERLFLQGLIQVCAHFVHLQKKSWSAALSQAEAAREKWRGMGSVPRSYQNWDLEPLLGALEYNEALLRGLPDSGDLAWERFLVPKLFPR